MSISKLIRYHEQVMNMRELSEQLYLTRREFIKGLVAVSAVSVTGLSGCLEYIKPKTPEPTVKKRFTPELRIEGDEEFKRNVENMLRVLREYSPEWYEKTMYAGEVIRDAVPSPAAAPDGTINFDRDYARLGGSKDIKRVLTTSGSLVHEVQHIIDFNTYRKDNEKYFVGEMHEVGELEFELRAGIGRAVYSDEIKIKTGIILPPYTNSSYEFTKNLFKEDKEKVDQVKYKDRLDAIEKMYFDHENKKLKTEFLKESWQQFKNL